MATALASALVQDMATAQMPAGVMAGDWERARGMATALASAAESPTTPGQAPDVGMAQAKGMAMEQARADVIVRRAESDPAMGVLLRLAGQICEGDGSGKGEGKGDGKGDGCGKGMGGGFGPSVGRISGYGNGRGDGEGDGRGSGDGCGVGDGFGFDDGDESPW